MEDSVKEIIANSDIIAHNRLKNNLKDEPNVFETVNRLKSILSEYTGLDSENILPTTGRGQALRNIFKSIAMPGDEILAYAVYDNGFLSETARQYGLTCRHIYPGTPFIACPDDILRSIEPETRLIYISNPNTTTGAILNISEIEIILERCPDIMVIVDEALFEYYPIGCTDLIKYNNNLIIKRSFSDGFELKNSNCDYLLSLADNIRKFQRANGNRYSRANLEAAILALGVINQEQTRWNLVKENIIYLSIRLRSMGIINRISPADFILVKVNDPSRVTDILNTNNHFAQNLNGYQGLDNYISIRIANDNDSHSLIEIFENMPSVYSQFKKSGHAKLTFKRKTADKSDHRLIDYRKSVKIVP
ncbi:MAG: aminotransferase class I/II-fold pyridoxal phosphate-dependent enzyme [Candidatus Zixiibacteriota bacterium]